MPFAKTFEKNKNGGVSFFFLSFFLLTGGFHELGILFSSSLMIIMKKLFGLFCLVYILYLADDYKTILHLRFSCSFIQH